MLNTASKACQHRREASHQNMHGNCSIVYPSIPNVLKPRDEERWNKRKKTRRPERCDTLPSCRAHRQLGKVPHTPARKETRKRIVVTVQAKRWSHRSCKRDGASCESSWASCKRNRANGTKNRANRAKNRANRARDRANRAKNPANRTRDIVQ